MRRRQVSWPQAGVQAEVRDETANDDRMRTLIEVSRASGVPMPEIARLQRDHPEELPAVTVGAALFFPEGIILTVQALAEAEKADLAPDLEGPAEPALPSPSPTVQPRPATPSRDLGAVRARKDPAEAVSQAQPDEVLSTTGYPDLAERIEHLEHSLRSLTAELADLTACLRRPPKASTSSS